MEKIFNEALALHQNGKIEQAIELYEKLLNPTLEDPYLLFLLGSALSQTSRVEDGIAHLKKSIQISPNPISYNNLGVVYSSLKRYEDAINSFNQAILLDSNYAEGLSNLGASQREAGLLIDSLSSLLKSIQLAPNNRNAFINIGNTLFDLEKYELSLENYIKANELDPGSPDTLCKIGNALLKLNRYTDALSYFNKAIHAGMNDPELFSSHGGTLKKLGKLDEALVSYDKSIMLKTDNAEAHNNRGNTLMELGRLDEALVSYDRSIILKSDFEEGYFNKALLKLLLGDYDEGWLLHEWRWKNKSQRLKNRTYDQKLWLGDESLSGETILIYPEQGLGDVIQFSRYIPMLVEHRAKVIFEVPQPLVNIMKTLPCSVTIIESGQELPCFDLYCPVMTLPLAFKTTVETIPDEIPYLFADPSKVTDWMRKVEDSLNLRVGLVWSGGFRPDQPEVWSVNERRNIPLAMLEPLNIPGVDYYSLQKGEDAVGQLRELIESGWNGPNIIDYSNEFYDFSDTAALIANLDLVIAVDTSTAHIAGAMGKPVWLLNRFDTDWRWFVDKEISPWYPSIRIFRQPKSGDWDSVVEQVKLDLSKLVAER